MELYIPEEVHVLDLVWVGGVPRPDLKTLTLFMIKSSWKSWKIATLFMISDQIPLIFSSKCVIFRPCL